MLLDIGGEKLCTCLQTSTIIFVAGVQGMHRLLRLHLASAWLLSGDWFFGRREP